MSDPVRSAATPKSDTGSPSPVREARPLAAGTLRLGRAGDAYERAADAAAQRTAGRAAPRRGPAPSGERRVDRDTERYLRGLVSGRRLPSGVRADMERSFGKSFGDVRVHDDAAAAKSARRLGAKAYTHGRDVVFGAGQWAPHTAEGRRLIAHELAHVVQQGAASSVIQRAPSAGRSEPVVEGTLEPELEEVHIGPAGAVPEVQAENGDEPPAAETPVAPETPVPAEGGGDGDTAPAGPATPTLALDPGNTLTRGDTLKAEVQFTPNAGETMRVTGWRYTTSDHGTVNRARAGAAETLWEGPMATGGTLEARYRITPDGSRTENAEETLTADVTVDDRSGGTWQSSVTDEAEGVLNGQPSPPTAFNQLGRHTVPGGGLPVLSPSTIANGPNTGMRYVASLTAGTYISRPALHPDLNDPTSRLMTFHQSAARLYHVNGATRTLIPDTEYSNLSSPPGGTLSFDVPDWEAFYKARGIIRVRATAGRTTRTLRNDWWGLDPNAEDGAVTITNDAEVRRVLGIGASDAYTVTPETVGSFSGFELMPAAAIVTGTQSHEYSHGTHSHRANFHAMMRALDPQKKIESRVRGIRQTVNFDTLVSGWWREIIEPNHELVDEAQSETQEEFVAVAGQTMAGVNEDPSSGAFLGNVWNIPSDRPMT